MTPEREIVAFLARHFGERLPEGEYVELRCLHPVIKGKTDQYWSRSYADLATRALAMTAEWNVYFGVNTRTRGGGKKADVLRLYCLHADIDAGDPDDLFPSVEEAFAALVKIEPRVSRVLASGGGLHAWWKLDSAPPATPETVREAEEAMRAIYRELGGTDRVQDVSRILRLPRTINHKSGRETRLVYG